MYIYVGVLSVYYTYNLLFLHSYFLSLQEVLCEKLEISLVRSEPSPVKTTEEKKVGRKGVQRSVSAASSSFSVFRYTLLPYKTDTGLEKVLSEPECLENIKLSTFTLKWVDQISAPILYSFFILQQSYIGTAPPLETLSRTFSRPSQKQSCPDFR